MFYRKDEAVEMWQTNEARYAEIAHQYPCCNVPTFRMCFFCEKEVECRNKAEVKKTLLEWFTTQ